MNEILRVEDVGVRFGNDEILRDISFSVNEGETVAVIGPNGAGKTVLLKALLGLVPHAGTVQWGDKISIGYVPQKLAVDRTVPITVREFFLLQEKLFLLSGSRADEKIADTLKMVDLPERLMGQRLGTLSGGQFQRMLVAWAMYGRPQVLLFDEPTAGVDVGGEETIYNTIHGLQDRFGITVILVSHELNIVNRYATKVLCVNRMLTCQGTPEEALTPQELKKLFGEPTFYHHLHEYHNHE